MGFPILVRCHLYIESGLWVPREQISIKFDSKHINFHSRKCINKRRLQQNGDHFISERTYHAQSNDIVAAHGTTLIQSNHSRVLSTRVQYFSVLYHFGTSESHSYTALEDLCHIFGETIQFLTEILGFLGQQAEFMFAGRLLLLLLLLVVLVLVVLLVVVVVVVGG